MSSHQPRFFNGPSPKQGPNIPYKNEAGGNPALGGLPLAILTKIIASSSWIQSFLWKLNKFDVLKDLPEIEEYNPRYDPMVIPIIQNTSVPLAVADLPQPRRRSNESTYYTSADFHEWYKSGIVTPSDVIEYILRRIVRQDGKPSKYSVAYVQTREDLVRAAAQASTERYKQGRPLSVFDGVPVAVKDEVDVQGYRRCGASKIDIKGSHDETSFCVQKWEDAGAIVVGKTNMHELGLDTCCNNPHFGTPLNPHNENYYTGGSSGGSACTVAQGICPVTLGCDGGGSIRIPSSFCGLWGLKPSHNRVSALPTQNGAYSLAESGPMSSNVDDLALAYRIMAQPNAEDADQSLFLHSASLASIDVARDKPKIIGIDRTWVHRSDPEVLKLFEAAIVYCTEKLGYKVVDVTIPLLPENQKAMSLTIVAEGMNGLTTEKLRQLAPGSQLLFDVIGNYATAVHFLACQRLRDCMMRHLAWLWQQYPGMLVLTPTTPCAGWKIKHPSHVSGSYGISDGDMTFRTMEYSFLANWTGTPAISCPMGYTEDVPVGLMAMGEWGAEEQLLAFGKDTEGILGAEGLRRPTKEGNWVDVLQEAKKQ